MSSWVDAGMSGERRNKSADMTPFRLWPDIMGARGREDFEMVVARYDEDISWSDAYAGWRTVYNKGSGEIEGAIRLENKGHLADTILRHIILRYDTLAKVTFFCHGSKNYRSDQLIREEGRCHRRFQEFIGLDDENGLVAIETIWDIPKSEDKYYDYEETVGDVYRELFGEEYKGIKSWAKGLWISVGRERIRSRPVEFYQKMLDWILKGEETSQHTYRVRGIYVERFLLEAFRK